MVVLSRIHKNKAHVSADKGSTTYLDKIETTETKQTIVIQEYDFLVFYTIYKRTL